jgi:26S proteasome regulatory subunit N2
MALVAHPPTLTSASGILALLEEPSNELKTHALTNLHQVVDEFWAEIADAKSLTLIEELSEDEQFASSELAAAVASKCFFHLEEYGDALKFALGAGQYFDVSSKSEYVETLVAKCIDKYIADRNEQATSPDTAPEIDPRMESIVERMFARCYAEGCYRHALGIALEARRLDKVEEVLQRGPTAELLPHCFTVSQTLILSRDYRVQVVQLLVKMFNGSDAPDYLSLCRCLQVLDDAGAVAQILDKLVRGTIEEALLAYQIAFDVCESDNQNFLARVTQGLPKPAATEAPAAAVAPEGAAEAAAEGAPAAAADAPADATPEPEAAPEGASADYWERVGRVRHVISEGFTIDLTLDFLYRHSKTDLLLLQNIKTAVDGRNNNSILHNATVVAHGYMSAGTTVDTFLRSNLEWMRRAQNWAKFTAIASIGVVHKGNVANSKKVLQPYLPSGDAAASPYIEGGALYAMGLIHANTGSNDPETMDYLKNALQSAGQNAIGNETAQETVQHGACLGLGLTGMASGDAELYEQFKGVLFTDSAIAGEAAALSIGLLLLGHGTSSEVAQLAIEELLPYAHETKHEKIQRGIALALALIMYGQEEGADAMIEQLSRDKNPVFRYGAMYVIGLAYCGTGNNSAIRRLLHVAVSDVKDDVRRAAVTCLGFILFRTPGQIPDLVSLLAESFSPHVRYGVCMAIGIGCAGTARADALALLEPMLEDSTDYVRQGALLAMALVLMQAAEARTPKARQFRDKLTSIIEDKHKGAMTKLGAILASGIIDAGGRNVVVSMQSASGMMRASAVVGLAVWSQYWFWYPYLHFLGLAFQRTAMIGLTQELKMPKGFGATCNARASQFKVPDPLTTKKEEKKVRIATVALSTTARARAREARKGGKDKVSTM